MAASAFNARCNATRTAPSVMRSRFAVSRMLWPSTEMDRTISHCGSFSLSQHTLDIARFQRIRLFLGFEKIDDILDRHADMPPTPPQRVDQLVPHDRRNPWPDRPRPGPMSPASYEWRAAPPERRPRPRSAARRIGRSAGRPWPADAASPPSRTGDRQRYRRKSRRASMSPIPLRVMNGSRSNPLYAPEFRFVTADPGLFSSGAGEKNLPLPVTVTAAAP